MTLAVGEQALLGPVKSEPTAAAPAESRPLATDTAASLPSMSPVAESAGDAPDSSGQTEATPVDAASPTAVDPADLSLVDPARFAVPVLGADGGTPTNGSAGSTGGAASAASMALAPINEVAQFVKATDGSTDDRSAPPSGNEAERRPGPIPAAPRAMSSAPKTDGIRTRAALPPVIQFAADRATIRTADGLASVTLDAHGYALQAVTATKAPTARGPALPYGLLGFNVTSLTPGGIATVDLTLPAGAKPGAYYKQDPATGALGRFDFDGKTGAVIAGNRVTLYLQDGGRGDADGKANGVVVDPGGPGSEDFWIESGGEWSYVGEAVDFWLDTMLEPLPDLTLVEWDFSYDMSGFQAEASGTAWSVTHSFNEPEQPVVAARVSPSSGEQFVVTLPFEVDRVPPAVSFAEDLTATAGQPVTITATINSTANITNWDWWELEDGEEWVQLEPNYSSSLTWTFPEAGEYEVWLEVTDEYGEKGSASVFVSVEPAAPATMVVTAPAAINEGEYATFDIQIADPERFDDPAVYADWNGTGDWELLDEVEFEFYDPQNGRYTIPHRYDNDPVGGGNYTAKFWVEDDWGTTDTAQRSIAVADVAPKLRPYKAERTANDPASVSQGLAGTVTPGPRLIEGLPRIGVLEGIGREIYYAELGANIVLKAEDPSFEDQESLTYQWTVPPGFAVNGNVLTVPVNAPRGELFEVKAKATDARGVSTEESFYLTVDDGPVAPMMAPLFTRLETTGWQYQVPNPYHTIPVHEDQEEPVEANQIKVRLRLTDESQAWVNRTPGVEVKYTYMVYLSNGNPTTRFFTYTSAENNANDFWVALDRPLDPGVSMTIDAYATVYRTENGQPVEVLRTNFFNQQIGLSVWAPPQPEQQERDPDIIEQIQALANLAESLPGAFAEAADRLVAALTGDKKWDAIMGLARGLVGGFSAYVDRLAANPVVPLMQWLLGAQAGSLQINSLDDVPAAVLTSLGLDEATIRSRIINILGEGNLEAIDDVAKAFEKLDDPSNPIDLTDPKQMWEFLTGQGEGQMGLDVASILTQIVNQIGQEAMQDIPRVAVQLALKFAPGLGMLKTILSTGQWLLDNAQALRDGFQPLFDVSTADLVDPTGTAVKDAVLRSLPAVTPAFLDFIARQFGLDRIKRLFREKIKDLPGQIEEKIRAFVLSKLPTNRVAPGGVASPYAGQVGGRYAFTYKSKSYQLIVARQSRGLDQGTYVVRIIQNGHMVVELDAKQIETNPIPTNPVEKGKMLGSFQGVLSAAATLEGGLNGSRKQAQLKRSGRRNGKSNVTKGEPATSKVELGKLADNLRKAVGTTGTSASGLLMYLEKYGCALLNAGCFAAGTKLWTPDGYRNVEDIRVGDLVFSRDDSRPDGLVEAKPVEQVFVRFTEAVHLHVSGQVIRTTDEHPFYVYNRGWVVVAELAAGEFLPTADGDWQSVHSVPRRAGDCWMRYLTPQIACEGSPVTSPRCCSSPSPWSAARRPNRPGLGLPARPRPHCRINPKSRPTCR